jgi:hypothetical protein
MSRENKRMSRKPWNRHGKDKERNMGRESRLHREDAPRQRTWNVAEHDSGDGEADADGDEDYFDRFRSEPDSQDDLQITSTDDHNN